MGYFANGTEGLMYEEDYCAKCAHVDGCPVWDAHLLFSYDLCNEQKHPGKVILDMLIPPMKDRPGNKRCTMFIAADRLTKGKKS